MKVEERSDGWGYNLILEMFHTECLEMYEGIKLLEDIDG